MEKTDVRKHSQEPQYVIRKQVIRLQKLGFLNKAGHVNRNETCLISIQKIGGF